MLKNYILFVFLISLVSCSTNTNEAHFTLKESTHFPAWLAKDTLATDQTSGIAFLKTDSSGLHHFLIADDIGKIYRLVLSDTAIAEIRPVTLSNEVINYFADYARMDFEEIVYDSYTGDVLLCLEGNKPDPKEKSGIFRLIFSGNDIYSDTITQVEKLNIQPHNMFIKYLDNNIFYEGLAADENYLYLGLEGFAESDIFTDSTVIFIVDKSSLKIIKELNTKELGIHTINGLYSDKNNSLYGVDRNNKKVFHLLFKKENDDFIISDYMVSDVNVHIPGYPSLDYVVSLESITMDDSGNVYLIDDPWRSHFIPSEEILTKLNAETANNFKRFIPVLFKFKLTN